MRRIVQINFKFGNPRSVVEKHWLEHAPLWGPKGEVKGLEWKIWLMNRARKTAGGIYLFKDAASAQAYVKGPIIAAARTCPVCSIYDADIQVWDILFKHTKITRGPVN
jgi:Putative mono-oxygenase ydhR